MYGDNISPVGWRVHGSVCQAMEEGKGTDVSPKSESASVLHDILLGWLLI